MQETNLTSNLHSSAKLQMSLSPLFSSTFFVLTDHCTQVERAIPQDKGTQLKMHDLPFVRMVRDRPTLLIDARGAFKRFALWRTLRSFSTEAFKWAADSGDAVELTWSDELSLRESDVWWSNEQMATSPGVSVDCTHVYSVKLVIEAEYCTEGVGEITSLEEDLFTGTAFGEIVSLWDGELAWLAPLGNTGEWCITCSSSCTL